MNLLDQKNKINRLDRRGMLGSIESLGLQCQQAWDEATKIKIPKHYRNFENILINGMGGSALGGQIIESLYGRQMKKPFQVINSYYLPGYVNSKTLYILSSYSGTTEEVLATFKAAKKCRAKIMVICAGGRLAGLAKKHRWPAYIFSPRFNPSDQPRMGLGYSIIGQLALLKKCGALAVSDLEIKKTISKIIGWHRQFGVKVPLARNLAKKTAVQFQGKVPIIASAGHLAANAHIIANQINENSKTFSAYFLVSELNHHLMEGMRFPASNKKSLKFLLIESALYHPRISQRFAVTKKVLKKNRIPYVSYLAKDSSWFGQAFEVLLFGSYVNFYLAMLNKIDPSPIPYVDYFKKELSRR